MPSLGGANAASPSKPAEAHTHRMITLFPPGELHPDEFAEPLLRLWLHQTRCGEKAEIGHALVSWRPPAIPGHTTNLGLARDP